MTRITYFTRRALGVGIFALALLALFLPRAAAASFAGGAGTAENPYKIATAAQLNNIRTNLSAHYKLTADIVFTEADFAEKGKYYNDGMGWEPIGKYGAFFTGTFDGDGHTITGLYQNISRSVASSAAEKYVLGGLFGCFNNYDGKISNLNMADCDIYAENTASGGNAYIGAVVGNVFNGTVENCHSSGEIIAKSSYSYAGGIAGYGRAVTGCSNTAAVSGNYTGGIVGKADAVSQSYNAGHITATSYAGGIVGYGSRITNCYNVGIITGTKLTDNASLGGISGQDGNITNCYSAGFGGNYAFIGYCSGGVKLTNCYYIDSYERGLTSSAIKDTAIPCSANDLQEQDTFAGFDFDTVWTFEEGTNYKLPVLRGVAHIEPENNTADFAGGNGQAYNPYLISNTTQLDSVRDHPTACYKLTRDITFTADDFAEGGAFYNSGIGWQPIGTSSSPYRGVFDGNGKTIRNLTIQNLTNARLYGLFGYAANSLIRDLHLTDIDFSFPSSNHTYAGGIVGDTSSNAATPRIANCSVSGKIVCAGIKFSSSYNYIGGISGYGGKITNCSSAITIDCSQTFTKSYIGGIVGYGHYAVTGCSNTGTIKVDTTTGEVRAGGIIGLSTSTIRECWNAGTVSVTTTTAATYSGGILGGTNTYNNCKLYDCYNTASISGDNVGGIAGGMRGEMHTSYNIGAVSGTNVGGIAGAALNTTTVTDCYFAADTADTGWGDGTACGTACTHEAMRSADTFTGFDFNEIWTMEGNPDYLYPELRAQEMIYEKTLLRIELTAEPTKTDYFVGETFDPTGMIVTAYYDNDTSAAVEPEIAWSTAEVGTQTVTLTVGDQTLTFEITVQEDPLPGLIAGIGFVYDADAHTVTLTDVPADIRVILAGYTGDQMVFSAFWQEAGTLTCTLPDEVVPDTFILFFLGELWNPLAENASHSLLTTA